MRRRTRSLRWFAVLVLVGLLLAVTTALTGRMTSPDGDAEASTQLVAPSPSSHAAQPGVIGHSPAGALATVTATATATRTAPTTTSTIRATTTPTSMTATATSTAGATTSATPLTPTPTSTDVFTVTATVATPTPTSTPNLTARQFLPLLRRELVSRFPTPVPTSTGIAPPGQFVLLWADNQRGNWDIWSYANNNPVPLTADWTSDEIDPAWSWDGRSIAFASNQSGHFEIYRMRADGTGRVQLTSTGNNPVTGQPAVNAQPAWSPDGSTIVFMSDASTFGNFDLFAIPANAGAPVVLDDTYRLTWLDAPATLTPSPIPPSATPTPTSTAYVEPTATPQPTVSYYDNYWRASTSRQPSYSPDGTHIAFTSNRRAPGELGGSDQIWIMDANGFNARRLTRPEGVNLWPRWSFDGQRIAFASDRDGNWAIYSIRVDGTEELRLTEGLTDVQPSWSPLGNSLVFVTARNGPGGANGRADLYTVSADGGSVSQLVVDTHQHYAPAWSP